MQVVLIGVGSVLQSRGNSNFFVNWLNIIHGLKKIDFSCKKGKIMYNSICLKPGSNYLVIRHLYHIKHDIWQSWNIFSPLYYSVLCYSMLASVTNLEDCGTMLQKLSKCEVKAWLCWNLITLLPLRFCVKSNFGEF